MRFKISQIAGDASYRKFYRVIINKKSKIIISAEKDKYKNLIAYASISKFLRKIESIQKDQFSRSLPIEFNIAFKLDK